MGEADRGVDKKPLTGMEGRGILAKFSNLCTNNEYRPNITNDSLYSYHDSLIRTQSKAIL